MMDIQGELSRLRQQREREYISIVELLDYLKKHNPNSSYSDIATYLLVKLAPYDVRNTADEIYGDEEYCEWVEKKGIEVFSMPFNEAKTVTPLSPESFFTALESVSRRKTPFCVFDDDRDVASAYLIEYQLGICIKRKRIEELLNIETYKKTKSIKQQSMTSTKSEEFIKNTDIDYEERLSEKDRIIEELRTKIAELENQLSDEIKQYNQVERNTHLQIIGGLVETLASKSFKFKRGCKINLSAIAKEIDEVTADYEDRAKERTIRARLTEALKKISTQHTESS